MQRKSSDRPSQSSLSLTKHVEMAGLATLILHPVRVALNFASYNPSIFATVNAVYRYMLQADANVLRATSYNILRGAMNTGFQAHANHVAQDSVQQDWLRKPAGLVAATLTGTVVASFVEVPFMRQNAADPLSAKLPFSSLFKFNVPIQSFFVAREFGFTGAVLISKDLPAAAHYSILLTAAWLTASCHKLVMIEATKDLASKQYTYPDYSKGMRHTFFQLSQGAYTHPALRVPISNPATMLQRTANVLYATCGPNMFFWRLVYLKSFSELLSQFKKHAQHAELSSPKLK